jgi:hypothetical protein
MTAERDTRETPEVDEGSWVYLSGSMSSAMAAEGLREQLTEACEGNGWAIVTRSPEERVGRGADPGHFLESVRHAVEHADVVIALMGERTEISEAELVLAVSHGRPVVGVRLSAKVSVDTGMQTMLQEYGLARVVTCRNAEECAIGVREALADPDFAETIRLAG